MQHPRWRPKRAARRSGSLPGTYSEDFGKDAYIYRCIKEGLLTFTEAETGPASLADVAKMNEYLDMIADVQQAEIDRMKEEKGGKRRW